MALVFISHAHRDELLARKVCTLLSDALGLVPADFFLSSQEGHGVAPSAGIRASITSELVTAPALVVLITPTSAASPWVWLEAGNRLGCADKPSPIFAVPSARFVPLLTPVADLRCLQMDTDGDLHELVKAVGVILSRPPVDFLNYKLALDDVVQTAKSEYSLSAERRARAVSWIERYAAGLLLALAGLAMLGYARMWAVPPDGGVGAADAAALQEWNDTQASLASTFLILKGRVTFGENPVHGATVMVARDLEVQDPAACVEPECTKKTTTTEGEFTLNLTKIQARNGDVVTLSVQKEGFKFFSKELRVDVRATDAGTTPQIVTLAAQSQQ